MSFNNPNRLTLDLKCQDRLREWFSKRSTNELIQLSCVELGDSDINYELSQQVSDIRILNAPYQVEGVKHKLIFIGSAENLTGKLTNFIRYVDSNGIVNSYYNYPTNTSLSAGVAPPTLANGIDTNNVTFNTGSFFKEGFIMFFQTLPDGYVDPSDGITPLRLIETYNFTLTNLPNSWEVIIDEANGSLFIARPDNYVFLGGVGLILAKGTLSSITKTVTFNW